MELPSIHPYKQYSSSNYGAHCLQVRMNGWTLWFSYSTLVAFSPPSGGRVVHENSWGPTTGKHLDAIDGGNKKARVSAAEFERLYQAYQEASAGKSDK